MLFLLDEMLKRYTKYDTSFSLSTFAVASDLVTQDVTLAFYSGGDWGSLSPPWPLLKPVVRSFILYEKKNKLHNHKKS